MTTVAMTLSELTSLVTPPHVIVALLVAIPVIVVLRVLIPQVWAVVRRARLHGPAPIASPNSGGRWLGWVVGMFWSLFEGKREENYDYSSITRVQRWNDDHRPRQLMGLPQVAVDAPPVTAAPGHALMSRDHQQLSEDGESWWTGRDWVSVSKFVPPSAPRSVDGSHWWDGDQWRWMPHEFPAGRTFLPPSGLIPSVKPVAESWLIRRRQHLNDRWYDKMYPVVSERSDPPPQGLPPIRDVGSGLGPAARRRWWRSGSRPRN